MNSILVIGSLLFALFFFNPKLLRSKLWRATVTPLASIIGSGFLVAGPILAHTAGNFAWLAILGLCALSYLFGAAVRHNILCVEPMLTGKASPTVEGLEKLSNIALAFAYFISVAYYLNLFAAFGLRLDDIVDPFWVRILSTIVIASVGTVGALGGLAALEHLEVGAVGLKLSLIGGVSAALLVAGFIAFADGSFGWTVPDHPHGMREFRSLLGLVILVQGFETSRYLGDTYDAKSRVKTMRWAQWISTGIYLGFILLITPYFMNALPAQGGESAIIDMLMPIGVAFAPFIIVVALASQLSAAVADMNGGGGLLHETSRGRLGINAANVLVAFAAIAIIWVANIYEIITYASKAFVFYYALQSLQAVLSAVRQGSYGSALLFSFGIAAALVVILFAIPVEI